MRQAWGSRSGGEKASQHQHIWMAGRMGAWARGASFRPSAHPSTRPHVSACLKALLVAGMLLGSLGSAQAQEKIVLTLEDSVKRALTRSFEVKTQEAEVEVFKGKKQQAAAASYPQLELTAVMGPSPRARGDQVSSPDNVRRPSIDHVFGRGIFTVIQPLYTFGLLSRLQEAADYGVNAMTAGVDKTSTDVLLRMKEIYYGLLLTSELRNLVLTIRDELTRTLTRVQRLLDEGASTVAEIDLYRLQTATGVVEKRLNEVDKGIELATRALKTFTGIESEVDVTIAERQLVPLGREIETLDRHLAQARALRPEFTQLQEGLKARKALVDVETARYYPHFFVGILGNVAHAGNRDRLTNPFVVDPLRHEGVAPILGFRLNTDFGITGGRVHEAKAELTKLAHVDALAKEGIPLQVQQAYLELAEAQRNIPTLADAFTNAKRWLVAAVANFDLGVGDTREVTDAAVGFATTRADYLLAVFNFNLGFARLDHATGRDVAEAKAIIQD